MKIVPYPGYKPSGVEWLGDAPVHWEVRRTKTLLKHRNVKGFPDEPLLAATQTKGVVRKEHYENRTVLALKDLHLLKLVRVGDFVISLRSFQGGIEYAREQGLISPAYTILYPANPDVRPYLAWLFKSRPYIGNLTLHVTGIRQGQNIDYSELSRSYLPVPPVTEQAAIVRYLDHVDRRIRRYVSAKRKLIALLEEEKQAVINQAVIRSLDPNVRLKPSGVEWLGDVPAHWEVTKLARVVRSSNAGEVIDKGWWGRGTEVLYTCARQSVQSDYASFPLAKRTTGLDLLLTRNGTPYVHRPVAGAIYSNVVQRITLTPGTDREWIALTLEASARGMKGYGVSIESLNYDMWKVLVVLVPPKSEQTAIVGYLDKATADLDDSSARARRQIELFEEYRTRLIADVVTGKLDVREAAAELPVEPDDADGTEADGAAEDVAGEFARADAV